MNLYTEIEDFLLNIWKRALRLENHEEIHLDDDFFELGGNSVMAAVIHKEILKRYAIELLMEDFFEYTTVKTLAEHIVEERMQVNESAV